MSSITQQLLEATDIIASKEAKQVSFDQTILCTVVQPTIENEEDMCYVSNGTIKFKAKNATGNKLSKNTSVYVTVPSGDYSNEKIIIATYKEEEVDDYKQAYTDITQHFIQAKEYSLSDFLPNNLVMLLANYDTSTDIHSCNYNFANDKVYFGHYNRVIMKAKFAMDVPELIAGEYIVRASFLDNFGEELWFGEISSKEILGNPYTINSSFEQEAIFTTDVIVEGEEGQETKQLNFDLVNKIQIKFYTPKADAFIDKDGENISWKVELEEFKLLLGYHKANFIANHGNIENGLVKIVLVDNTGKEIIDTKDILTPYHNATYKYDRYFGINYVNNSKIEVLNPLNSDISWRRYNPSLEDVWGEKLSQTGEANKYFKGTVKTSYNSSQFKAIYKDISSNIIKISKNDKDFETSSEDTLLYDVEDNNYNLTYPIYDQADEVVSSGIRPKFTITGFKNSYGDIEKNKVPMTVVWKIPVNATMISKPNDTVFSKDKKREWSDGSDGWYTSSQKIQGTEDFWNKVFILEIGLKNSFSDGATNNTIICQIIRDDDPKTTYQAKIVLHFARVGTTGEDYGLVITPDRSCLTNRYFEENKRDSKRGRIILTASLKQLSTGSDLTDDYDEQYWYDNLKMEFIDGAFGNAKNSKSYAMTIKKIGLEGVSKHSDIVKDGQNISDVIAEQPGDIVQDGTTPLTIPEDTVKEIPDEITSTTAAARSYMVRIFSYLTSDYFCVVKASFKLRNGRTLVAYQSIPRNYSNSYDVAFEGPGRLVYDSFGKLKTNASGTTYKAINGEQTPFPCVGIWYPGANNENWRQKENNQQINQHEWVKENTNPPSLKREIKNGKFSYKLMPSSTYPKSELQVASLVFYEETFDYKGTTYQTQYDKNGTLLSPEDALGSLNTSHWMYIYPIVIIQDTYFNDTIDAWDGSITQDNEVGMVLATSFAAGKKDSTTNEFTGIIMGDTSGVGNGLFGFSKGKTTFGFTENGSCWIGPSREIEFIAPTSSNQLGGLTVKANSLKINVGTENSGSFFIVDSDSSNAIFKIGYNNGNGSSHLKFYKPSGSSQYEVDIKAYNFTLDRGDGSGLWFNNEGLKIKANTFQVTTKQFTINSSATGSNEVINSNNKFTLDANGEMISTSCKIGDDSSYLKFDTNGLNIRAKIFILSNNETSLAFNDTGLTISTQSGTSSFKVDSTNLSITNAKLSGSFEKTDSYGNKILMGEYSNSLVFSSTYETYDNLSCLKIVDKSNKYSLGLGVQKTNIGETNAAISYIFPRNVTDGTLFISSGYIDSFSDKQNGAKLTLQAGRFKANTNNTMDGFSRIILIGNYSGTSDKGEINIETNITRVYGTFSPENGTSDSRLKYSIEEYSSQYDQFFDNLKPVRYKYYHGTSSRYHTGFIAQDIVTGLEEAGLTTQDFAAILKVQWPEYQDIYGEIWQLRRDEIVSLNTWQIQKLKARIIELENKLASFEAK